MECTVSWTGATGARSGMGFLAETGSGHVLVAELPVAGHSLFSHM